MNKPGSRAHPRRASFMQRADEFDQRLAEARSRSDADVILAHILVDPAIDTWFQVHVAESLSRTRGQTGSEALRKEIAATLDRCSKEPNKRKLSDEYDLIAACAHALGAREDSAATDAYVAMAEHPNMSLSEYGMGLLARDGDDSAWEKILTRLTAMLHRPMNRDGLRWSAIFWAIEYLTKHAPNGSYRATRLIALVRSKWRSVADPGALEQHWPGIGPDGPGPALVAFPRPSLSEIKWLRAAEARRNMRDLEWEPELRKLTNEDS